MMMAADDSVMIDDTLTMSILYCSRDLLRMMITILVGSIWLLELTMIEALILMVEIFIKIMILGW
jgi:hypothetical protein